MIVLGYLLFAVGLGWAVWVAWRQFTHRIEAYEERYIQSADAQLDALLAFMSPQDLLRISRMAGVGLFFVASLLTMRAGLFFMLVLSGGVGFAAFYAPRLVLRVMLHFRRRRFLEQFPDSIGMLNNAMKAGLSFMQAVEMVAREAPDPVGQELKILCRDRQTGKTMETALDRLSQRIPLPDVRIFTMVIKLSNRMGGNVTDALARLAETIRNRFMLEKKIRALTAEGRMQAVVVCALPFILFLAFAVIAPEMMRPLTQTAAGFVVLGAVVVLEIVGGYFMWRATKIKY